MITNFCQHRTSFIYIIQSNVSCPYVPPALDNILTTIRISTPNPPISISIKHWPKPIHSLRTILQIWKRTKSAMYSFHIISFIERTDIQSQPPTCFGAWEDPAGKDNSTKDRITVVRWTLAWYDPNNKQSKLINAHALVGKVLTTVVVHRNKPAGSLRVGWGIEDRKLFIGYDLFPQIKAILSWGSPLLDDSLSLCIFLFYRFNSQMKITSPILKSARKHSIL